MELTFPKRNSGSGININERRYVCGTSKTQAFIRKDSTELGDKSG